MNIVRFPEKNTWQTLLQRPVTNFNEMEKLVAPILENIKTKKDEALFEYVKKFDKIDNICVEKEVLAAAENQLSDDLKIAIQTAYGNIYRFHEQQKQLPQKIETMTGVTCWRKSVGIEKVGIYIPGGTAPLFSTILMLGIPAKIAGCKEIILCSPSNHPAIYYTANLVGVTKVLRMGGAQAIAAMAYGTETVPKVDKIFGPGNQFVTTAKTLISKEGIAIDMPAGPSEVAVLADHTANPVFVAADLLSQAEHGTDSQVFMITTSEKLIAEVQQQLASQLSVLTRKEIAEKALENSTIVLVKSLEEGIELANSYAAEHLILALENAEQVAEEITNAGSIFLGNYTPESCGDYASGTNHTLPTNGFARAYSGVSVDSFVKKITVQNISEIGIQNIGKTVEIMAAAEGLDAHKNAVTVRLKALEQLSINN